MTLLERLKRLVDRIRGKYDQRTYDRMEDNQYVSDELLRAIEKGIKAGESIPNISKRILQIANKSKNSAVTTARTETNRIVNRGRNDAFHEAAAKGIQMTREWIATPGERTRDSHAALDGQEVGLDEPFISPESGAKLMFPGDPSAPAEEVINCFIGETAIFADSPIKCSFKRHYEGELITIITAGGIQFTCTPNHPILTNKGWIAAAKLNVSDNLIVGNVRKDFVSRANPNKNDIPITIGNFHDFGDVVGAPKWVASVNVNFHGDISHSDVEIKSTKGFLMNWAISKQFEEIYCILLKFTNFASKFFGSKCMIDKFGLSDRSGTPSDIRESCKSFPFLVRGLCHSIVHGFGTVSNRSVAIAKNPVNDLSATSIISGELLNGFTGKVELDDIVRIDNRSGNCHVYNLHTKNNLYLVNSIPQNRGKCNGKGVIVHNCRCTVVAKLKL